MLLGISVAGAFIFAAAGLVTDTAGQTAVVGYYLVSILGMWLYYAACESSSKQATLGKRAVDIAVTDTFGQRLSFGRASGRAFAKGLNALTLGIGWIVIAFSQRKRGLHDFVAGTLVVHRTRESQSNDLPSVAGSVNQAENSIAASPARYARPATIIALCIGLLCLSLLAVGVGAYVANRQADMPPAAAEPQPQRPNASATPAPASPLPTRARPAQRTPRPPTPSAVERPRTVISIPAASEPSPIASVDPPAAQSPQQHYEEFVVPADSVLGLQIDMAVTSDSAKIEDQVRARITRDVKVRDYVAIPAGARAEGTVTLVETGGRLKDQARLGIRFHTIELADGTRLSINTETIYRDGESPAKESAARIGGGAVAGAVLGAILGGKKGAVIGTTIGASAGGAAVAASDPNPATLPAGSTVTVRMSNPVTVTVEKSH